ncbi:hypothetical protein [Microterricola viridarii]|uniref:Uncharacterized protein n=1 Tax=Microterricola viridarii TaxID=412690 RepID=A0A0X8E1H3_9MICO|nr:hypothetical protein [Microterricola viridarii]AMB58238.1 hypothetical protein AWU67_04545 [Microterricola viridarii]
MSQKISSPIVTVLVEAPGTDELTSYTVQTDNRDMVQWDVIRARKSWPAMSDAPILSFTVIAWNALRRSGAIATQGLDDFMAKCVDVYASDADGVRQTREEVEGSAPVDPTLPVPDPGY